jgi:hypothetical protein
VDKNFKGAKPVELPVEQPIAFYEILRQGLRDLGYVEGRHLVIEYRPETVKLGWPSWRSNWSD